MHETNGSLSNGSHLHREAAEFLAEGFARNDPVVVIATVPTRRAVEAELARLGWQLRQMECLGRARCVDSHEVLARILVNGVPDERAFATTMEQILAFADLRVTRRRIRAYHDLVDALRGEGDGNAAVLLDRLWTDLCQRNGDLLLAYTAANLYREKDCAV